MAAPLKMKIRFQHWAVGMLLGFVAILTALYLFSVISKFQSMAEDTAKARFGLLARHGTEQLKALIDHASHFVTLEANAGNRFYSQSGRLNDHDMLRSFISSLENDESLYSHYFALENDDFFQVVNVRGDSRVIKALSAPEGTRLAVRKIVSAGGKREESWEFLGPNGGVLAARKGETKYFPSQRPWYEGAKKAASVAVTDPYIFASSGELGVTISNVLPGGIGVLGTDVSLRGLEEFLARLSLTDETGIVILDRNNRILAFHSDSPNYLPAGKLAELTPLANTGSPYLAVLQRKLKGGQQQAQIEKIAGEKFVFAQFAFSAVPGTDYRVAAFAPMREFSEPIVSARNEVILIAVGFLLVLMPLAVVGSGRVGRALSTLALDSERIKNLDFSGKVSGAESILYEVDTLGQAHQVMKDTLQLRTTALTVAEEKLASLVDNGLLLSRERDRNTLLRHILFGGKRLCNCDAGTMYLMTERGTLQFTLRTNDDHQQLPTLEIPLYDPETRAPNDKYVSIHAALYKKTVVIDDVYTEQRFDLSGTRRFDAASGYRTVSMLTVPMAPHEGEVIGVLQFLNALDPKTGEIIPFAPELVGFVEALASQSAVALENHNLLEAQKALMESLIKLVAGAIDTKSPYTGGHCARVPELAFMLAEEAARVTEGPLAGFQFNSEDEWREFRIGAWLHDCGKVTTPEYVVDKATKLETIYNRIHEVRTRFEILLRDAEIERLQAIAGGTDAAAATRQFEARKAQLADDFAFVADCNIGGEVMAPERVDRIKSIASRTWVRHFDDRLGLSHEELRRYDGTPAPALPVVENLLADKPHHRVSRDAEKALDPKYGFKVKVPEFLYNLGEMHNLCIGRGTLSEEDRFKINEHIIQTIVMLDQMPFPKNLRRVPEYAGTHHETLTGTGYPRKLTKDELSVPARIMAIADIFEALTASDRPYKKAKTLSESLKILSAFRDNQHIDADLFELFLRSGVYLRYAERFLRPEQIDPVDLSQYLQ